LSRSNAEVPPADGGHEPAARRVDRRAFAREFPSGDPTATECAQNLILASSRFTDADTRALRRHGLSIAARVLLATLEAASEPLPANVLADRLLVSGASITSLVDTLERRGLVRRVRPDHDRRIVLIDVRDHTGARKRKGDGRQPLDELPESRGISGHGRGGRDRRGLRYHPATLLRR